MHATLKPGTNAALIAASALVVAAAFFFTRPPPVIPALVGAFCGVIVGRLQSRAIEGARAALRETETAWDVRRALMAAASGRRAIRLQWVAAAVVVAVAVWLGMPLGGSAAGYGLLMCVRDLLTLRAVIQLGPERVG
jgi:uncharacterized membrane protein